MGESRVKNTARNMVFASLYQVASILLAFISRKVFVLCLPVEYLGLSGLFGNLLRILALAELGFGTAIIYGLYKPIAENDITKIKSYMRLYKRVYCTIGCSVLFIGAVMIPFLPFFIKEIPDLNGLNINIIFYMFVAQTAVTYFFSYKLQFVVANQKDYKIKVYDMISFVSLTVLQIVTLLLWKNYYLYLAINIVVPFIKNVFATRIINKEYPFLKEKAEKLPKNDMKKVTKNVVATFLYKVSSTLSATIDTILVSKFMGLTTVGIYYNYHMIIQYSDQFFITVLGTITPSIGNFFATNDLKKKESLFTSLQLVYFWISSYLAVGMIVLFNDFMELWLGKEFLFPQIMVVALVVSITLTNFQRPCSLLRDADGLFWYGKFRPLVMIAINVVCSTYLVKTIGTVGVVWGAVIAKVTTYVWYDPYVVYKHSLKSNVFIYYFRYMKQWLILGGLTFVCWFIYQNIPLQGLVKLIVGFVIITVIVNGMMFLVYRKTDGFNFFKERILNLLKRNK